MGYLSIKNLYADQTILLFKECFALQKVHGTSSHVTFKEGRVRFFSGGANHESFVKLFNEAELLSKFQQLALPPDKSITFFGEAYGGKLQGMDHTYGKDLKFVAFDVQIGESWLNVPIAEKMAKDFGFEFVHYTKVSTDLASLDAARDAESMQAIRNGMGGGKKEEGVVLRPLIEMTLNNGSRLIAKHKRSDFSEVKTPRPIVDPTQLAILSEANLISEEWMTANRLKNVLSHFKEDEIKIENFGKILSALVDDVYKEGAAEFVDSKEVRKALSKKASELIKSYFHNLLPST